MHHFRFFRHPIKNLLWPTGVRQIAPHVIEDEPGLIGDL